MNVRLDAPGSSGVRATNWLVVVLCFLPIVMDGFDATALALAVPALAESWGLASAAFTVPLVVTSVGVFAGYLGSGWLAQRFGRRRLLIGSVALFSLGTMVTAVVLPAHSIEALGAVRLVTGLGFGGALPSAVAVATDFSSNRRRDVVSLLMALGVASGATAAGFVYLPLIASVGVTGLFWLAGVASAVLVLPMAMLLPPEPAAQEVAGGAPRGERVGQLFARRVRVNTLLLWLYAFLVFTVSTALSGWAPVLLTDLGVSAAEAPLGLAFIYLGAIVGGVAMIPLVAWAGIGRMLIVMPLLTSVLVVASISLGLGGLGLLIALCGVGAAVSASQNGQLAMAVELYPREQRTTGVGWSSAMGRVGSVAGPGVTGALLALGTSAGTIFYLAAGAMVVAVVCAALLRASMRSGARAS
ncbi:MFS transporter [Nonomuraea sp. B1E8]|uniref:MFS transporter n=1 Tax=unclassified Nonomuraea TaxID=2593643 RepID=UPI00325C8034